MDPSLADRFAGAAATPYPDAKPPASSPQGICRTGLRETGTHPVLKHRAPIPSSAVDGPETLRERGSKRGGCLHGSAVVPIHGSLLEDHPDNPARRSQAQLQIQSLRSCPNSFFHRTAWPTAESRQASANLEEWRFQRRVKRGFLPGFSSRGRRSLAGRFAGAGTTIAGRTAGTGTTFSGVICSIDCPLTCTKLSSRAARRALTASFTFDRAMKFPKKISRSACSMATTQSTYFESNAVSASCTDSPTPSFTASGAQRVSKSQTEPSLDL